MCCADFNFYINRQGIQGRKGDKGETGFSPAISVGTDTPNEYKLIIANESNSFETPNLRGNINVLDNGGTYLRYDAETQQISAQGLDAATSTNVGGVLMSTDADIEGMGDGSVITPADLADALPIYLQGEGAVTITQDEETSKTKINVDLSSVDDLKSRVSAAEAEIVGIQADVADLDADNSDNKAIIDAHTNSIADINDSIASLQQTKQAKLTAGEGITIDENNVISAEGGGGSIDTSNLVTLDTTQTITSRKVFAYGSSNTPAICMGADAYSGLGWYSGTYPSKVLWLNAKDSSADMLTLGGWDSSIVLSDENVKIGTGSGFPTPSYLEVTPDSLTFKKTDGTSVDLLAGGSESVDTSNLVTLDTQQTIVGLKTFQSSIKFGQDANLQINLNRSGANRYHTMDYTGSYIFHLNSKRGRYGFEKDPIFTNGFTGGDISSPESGNYQVYLRAGNITSTGGTVEITDNGLNGINIEAVTGGGGGLTAAQAANAAMGSSNVLVLAIPEPSTTLTAVATGIVTLRLKCTGLQLKNNTTGEEFWVRSPSTAATLCASIRVTEGDRFVYGISGREKDDSIEFYKFTYLNGTNPNA